ncbi:MAG: hypothetical protein H6606_05950 [Flavobacteriales bacterium]|nr:hypothetical protein [Flavobacteriales bacterium]
MKKQYRTGKRTYVEVTLPDTNYNLIASEVERKLLQSLANVRLKEPIKTDTGRYMNYSIWCDVVRKLHMPLTHVRKPIPGFVFSFMFHEWMTIAWMLESINIKDEQIREAYIEILARINSEILFIPTDTRENYGT